MHGRRWELLSETARILSAARGIWSRRAAAVLCFFVLTKIAVYLPCCIDVEAITEEVCSLRITFERSGGFAGITISTTVNTDDLSISEADELRRLIEEADFFNQPAVIAPHEPHPDRFQYEVTVQDDGRLHTIMVSEEVMPENLRPLIRWLSEAARKGRTGRR
jgi:hypothetical protein